MAGYLGVCGSSLGIGIPGEDVLLDWMDVFPSPAGISCLGL